MSNTDTCRDDGLSGKRVKDSRVVVSQVMQPADANPAGNVHGGSIMKLIDNAAGVVAIRHSRCNAVTASVDRLDFHYPAFVGDLLILFAGMNMTGTTSMEIGVRAEAEDLMSGERRHIASAYLTYVGLDPEMNPRKIPPLIPETAEEKRRNREARARREARLTEKKSESESEKGAA
ncbi:MAG: acyl-CoA thioesterase [Desulfobacterales bacterium]|nr:acyl-CoA thioesterase [Desulfobacterales bacterium]